ncbi:sugar transferase [Mesorhizobium sp. CAU 1741]|uniref:sugar transferase n=1 Tax=Mesorhizobium sp. CAU 1741 TaxID=3140366 RepID=UPI00325A4B1F
MNEQAILQNPVKSAGNIVKVSAMRGGVKRALDVVISCILLVAFLPVLFIISTAVSIDGGPVLYGHRRVGRNGIDFLCLKFRTMVIDGDEVLASHFERNPAAREEWLASRKLRDDPRVTFIGNLLRRTSLDELPQLLNVLRGDMSLVGPRPIVHDEIVYYRDSYSYYTSLRPGLTGAWQTSGRSDTSYDERVAFDVDYAKNQSLSRDLHILLRTIPAVLMTRGSF